MSNETKTVDVLALLDALALQTRQRGGSPSVVNIEDARDAIAELIEAAKAQHKAIDWLMARLIEKDPAFMPSESKIWNAVIGGRDALTRIDASP